MQRWALLAGAAVVGILFAVILLQRPDTGGEVSVPARKPTPAAPVAAAGDEPDAFPARSPRPSATPAEPDELVAVDAPQPEAGKTQWTQGANPRAAELQAKQQQPEALQSGKAAIPWTLIRRNLLRMDDPTAKDLGTRANQMMLDLRRNRRDPDVFPYEELEQRQRDLVTELRSSSYVDDPEIADMVVRVEEILDEYHTLQE